MEQEYRGGVGVIRERRVKGTRRQSRSRDNKRKKSKGEHGRAAAGIIRERRLNGNMAEQQQG